MMRPRAAISIESVKEALATASSRRILSACITRAHPVKHISDASQVPLASAYRQVRRLLDDGLLVVERSAMTSDGKRYELYRSRLRRAELAVDSGGTTVTWELNAGMEDRLVHLWDQIGDGFR